MAEFAYQVEPYEQAIEGMRLLYQEHWEEVALDKGAIRLNPDYAKYSALAKAGILNVVTARVSGELIGYHISMVWPHIHYADSLTAFTDIFFLKREYRKGTGAGVRLLKFMEKSLRERGVQKIYMGTKLLHDIGPLLERLGYKAIERIYTKVLS